MNCKSCNTEVPQTEGKREKKFCSNSCRTKYWSKVERPRIRKEGLAKAEEQKVEKKLLYEIKIQVYEIKEPEL